MIKISVKFQKDPYKTVGPQGPHYKLGTIQNMS